MLATPPWVVRSQLNRLSRQVKERTRSTGVQHVLDHIVPICHPKVCGLNVPWNLQIITEAKNVTKGNTWYDEPEAWFSAPEQFLMFGATA